VDVALNTNNRHTAMEELTDGKKRKPYTVPEYLHYLAVWFICAKTNNACPHL
jgi:hypothetical protein